MVQSFPSIIVIGGLSHQRIGHRKPTEARIVQVAERVGGNLRNQLLHHRRARRLYLRNGRLLLRPAVQVRRVHGFRVIGKDAVRVTEAIAELLVFVVVRGGNAVRLDAPGFRGACSDGEDGDD